MHQNSKPILNVLIFELEFFCIKETTRENLFHLIKMHQLEHLIIVAVQSILQGVALLFLIVMAKNTNRQIDLFVQAESRIF